MRIFTYVCIFGEIHLDSQCKGGCGGRAGVRRECLENVVWVLPIVTEDQPPIETNSLRCFVQPKNMTGFTLLFTWHLQTWHTCQCWFGSWGDFLKGSYFEISLHAILCSLCMWRVGWCWEGAGHLETSLCLWAKLFLRSSGIFHLQRFQVQAFLVRRCGSFRKLLNLSLPTYKMGILPTPTPTPMGIEMLCGIVLGVRSLEARSGDTIPAQMSVWTWASSLATLL